MNTLTGPPNNAGTAGFTDENFKRAIGISCALHLLLFILFAVRAVLYPTDSLNLEDAIRVDIVALPDKTKAAELPPAAPEPVTKTEPEAKPEPPKPEPKKEIAKPEPKKEVVKPAPLPVKPESPKISLEKTKKDQAAALKRLEALERIEKMQKSEAKAHEATPKSPATSAPAHASVQVRGNTISAGTSLKGLQRLEHQGYLASVQQSVKRHWNLPQWLANANLSARVRIFVDASGNVVKRQIMRTSGNSDFDERVLNAIDASSPLTAPPSDLVNILAVDGLDADFP